jgi:phosphoribosylformylglycinamidine synthase
MAALGLDGQGSLPVLDLEGERAAIHAVTEIIREGCALSCHDISEGGLFAALAEMVIGGWGMGRLGAEVDLRPAPGLAIEDMLFAECGGFVLEMPASSRSRVTEILAGFGIEPSVIGKTMDQHVLIVRTGDETVARLEGPVMREAWLRPVRESMG